MKQLIFYRGNEYPVDLKNGIVGDLSAAQITENSAGVEEHCNKNFVPRNNNPPGWDVSYSNNFGYDKKTGKYTFFDFDLWESKTPIPQLNEQGKLVPEILK
jgi:hypothetical protein